MSTNSRFTLMAAAVVLSASVGCRKETPSAAEHTAADNPQVAAMLAKADVVDGQEDKVVHRCASCRLGMDGSDEHELVVGEYRMHFCSSGCRDRFAQNTTANIVALVIPEGG